ncbi:unnamed protein product [Bursaphelenchus xylophilus]|uniref:(pine wood nematode) hypothetical protein n=1 Tax=Bursaphelenchus xylophilus TaxID=6326 RepID=A0A1I7S827_BURXY|nr:unnamed protein product [Bursaphelenchus xylophilus]CAG9080655.1 unnamed protein product [Bursaphelenchus xylophilus]
MSADLVFSGKECSLEEFPTQSHNLINTLFAVEKFALAFEECTDVGDSQGNAVDTLSEIKQVIYDIIDSFRGANSAELVEKAEVSKEAEELKRRNVELEGENEELLRKNQELLDRLSSLESEGTGAEKQILEGNRLEILRLQDVIESNEQKHSLETQALKERIDKLNNERNELEHALEFERTEREAILGHFEQYKEQKEAELQQLEVEMEQADKCYMALNKGKPLEKENVVPTEKKFLEESLSAGKLNTTKTISSDVSVNMDDTLMKNPPNEAEDETKMGIAALISILGKVYEISNLLVQYMKGNRAADPKNDWIEQCRSQRKMLFELIGLLKKAEKEETENVSLNIEPIAQHLNLMWRTLETVSRRK